MKSETDETRIKLRSAIQTDVGVVREHNEDSAVIDDGADFFVVADGMGGHAAGEVASAMAVETVSEELAKVRDAINRFAATPTDQGRKELVGLLETAVRKAHTAVYERGLREPDKQGMGTTLDVVLLAGPEAFVAHVGDSRTYLIRDGKAAQITTDHTVAEVLVIEGKLSIEEAQLSPLRTILVNAIGVAPEVGVEMAHVRLRTDDQLLLCSDGLHDYFPSDHELADHIAGSDPKDALNTMVELAKARGGHDNITGIIVEVLDAPHDDGDTAFEVDLTQPAADMSAVPEPIASGDTLPHEMVEETDVPDEITEPLPDMTRTIPLRPVGSVDVAAREKLARASTIPPEDEDDDDDDDDAEETKPGDKKASDKKADEAKADEAKADEAKADEAKADAKADDAKADEAKAADKKADDKKAADKQKADDKKADDKKAADKPRADDKKADDKKAADKPKADDKKADNNKPKAGDKKTKTGTKKKKKSRKQKKKDASKKSGA